MYYLAYTYLLINQSFQTVCRMRFTSTFDTWSVSILCWWCEKYKVPELCYLNYSPPTLPLPHRVMFVYFKPQENRFQEVRILYYSCIDLFIYLSIYLCTWRRVGPSAAREDPAWPAEGPAHQTPSTGITQSINQTIYNSINQSIG